MHRGSLRWSMLLAAVGALQCMAVGPSGGAAQAAEPGRGTGILNVQVSHGDATAYGQPALAVNPRNPRNLLGAAWTSDNAEEAFSSFDEGRTWRDNGPLPLPAGVTFSRYRIGRWHEPTSYRSGVRSAILPGMRPSTSSSSGPCVLRTGCSRRHAASACCWASRPSPWPRFWRNPRTSPWSARSPRPRR